MSVMECLGVAVSLITLLSAANAAYCHDGLYYFYCGDGCCYSKSYYSYSYTTVCCSATTEGWMIGMGVGVAVVVVLMIICALYCRYTFSKKAAVGATGAGSSQHPAKPATQPVRVGTTVHSHDGTQANFQPPPPPHPQMHAYGNSFYPPPPGNPAFPPPPGNPAFPPPPGNPAFPPPPGNPAFPPPPAYSYGNAPY